MEAGARGTKAGAWEEARAAVRGADTEAAAARDSVTYSSVFLIFM